MLLLKIFLWALATFLSGAFGAIAKGAEDVHIAGGLYWDATASRIVTSFFLLLAAWAVVVWIFAPLTWSHWVKVVLCLVCMAVTVVFQQLSKMLFE